LSLPLVHRELLVAARTPSAYRVRIGFTAVAIVLGGLWLVFGGQFGAGEKIGGALFVLFAAMSYLGAMLAGPFLTAEAISAERREGTLGLLFLTRIGASQIVLGKLASAAVQAAQPLLGVAPVMAMTLLMGGVTGGEFWRVLLVVALTAGISLALGLAVSACVRDSAHTVFTTLLLLVFWEALGWMARGLAAPPPPGMAGEAAMFLATSPSLALVAAMDSSYMSARPEFFHKAAALGAALPFLTGIAAAACRRTATARGLSERSTPFPWFRRRRVSFPEQNPLAKLFAPGFAIRAALWTPALLMYIGFGVSLAQSRSGPRAGMLFNMGGLILGIFLSQIPLLAAAWHLSSSGVEYRRSGMMDLVRLVPGNSLPAKALEACGYRLLALPLLALGAVQFAAVCVPLFLPGNNSIGVGGIAAVLFSLFGLVLRGLAVLTMGQWYGLTEANVGRAFLKTAGFCVLLPLVLPCLLDLLALAILIARGNYLLANRLTALPEPRRLWGG
jgi:hypothetical protein